MFSGEWWETLSNAEQIFWAIAIVFSVLFVIQFVLTLIGVDFDTDADVHADVTGGDYSLEADFTLLSVRSIIAFFTFFGWTGVMMLKAGSGIWITLGSATGAGFLAMLVVGYVMFVFARLTQVGNASLEDAVYSRGQVYLSIPAGKTGHGKVHITLNGSLREVDAVTEGDTLPTGSEVKVIDILSENLLLVEELRRIEE